MAALSLTIKRTSLSLFLVCTLAILFLTIAQFSYVVIQNAEEGAVDYAEKSLSASHAMVAFHELLESNDAKSATAAPLFRMAQDHRLFFTYSLALVAAHVADGGPQGREIFDAALRTLPDHELSLFLAATRTYWDTEYYLSGNDPEDADNPESWPHLSLTPDEEDEIRECQAQIPESHSFWRSVAFFMSHTFGPDFSCEFSFVDLKA